MVMLPRAGLDQYEELLRFVLLCSMLTRSNGTTVKQPFFCNFL